MHLGLKVFERGPKSREAMATPMVPALCVARAVHFSMHWCLPVLLYLLFSVQIVLALIFRLVGGEYGPEKDREGREMGWEVGPFLYIPGNGRCGKHMEGYCVSNTTNRILINVSGYNKTEVFYPYTNILCNIGHLKFHIFLEARRSH